MEDLEFSPWCIKSSNIYIYTRTHMYFWSSSQENYDLESGAICQIFSKSTLGGRMPVEEKKKLRQELKSLKMEDISSFMESLPSDFLTVLRTDGLLRSLISKLGAPQRIRLLGYVKYALHGLSPKWDPEYEYFASDAYSRLMTRMNYIKFRLLIEALELLSCLNGVMSSFIKGLEGMLFSTGQVIRSLLLLLPT